MGSSLRPVLANIFTCDFEEKWIRNSPSDSPDTLLMTRFPCLIAKTGANTYAFLEYFSSRYNRYNSTIKFTCELEQAKPKQHLHHIYLLAYYLREEDITGLYTKWDSFSYITQIRKQPCLLLIAGCSRICSTASLLQSAIEDLKRLLMQNSNSVPTGYHQAK